MCLAFGSAGIGYVWQKDQIARLGKQIKQREVRLEALQDQTEKLRKQLGAMRGPDFLEGQIKHLNLGLVQPQVDQVWRLTEPPRELVRTNSERQFAARESLESQR
jgi:hypothetical protein